MKTKEDEFDYEYERKELIKIVCESGTSSYKDFCEKAFLDLDMDLHFNQGLATGYHSG